MTRLMLYNTYRGGEGRLDPIIEAVNTAHPDFLGILEAVGWGNENERPLKQFAQRGELPFSYFAKSNTKYDLAFLGRREPLHVHTFNEGVWHGIIIAEVTVPSLDRIAVVLVHLDPRKEDYRLKELEKIQALTSAYSHVVLMGDLNSLSPHDPYDHDALMKLFKESGIEKFGSEKLQFDCMERIESWGFLDVMRELRKPFAPTVPTLMNLDPMHATQLRLDYIFISPSLRSYLKDASVLRTPITEAASDHYPLIVDLAFPETNSLPTLPSSIHSPNRI